VAHIRPASKGKFRIFIHVGKGKYQSYLFKGTLREAERKAASITHEQTQGTLVAPNKITTGDYLDQWLAANPKGVSRRTLEGYRWLINKHLKPRFGDTTLAKLHPMDIQTYYQDTSRCDGKGKLSKQTVLHLHRLLHVALRGAVKKGLLAFNPAGKDKIDLPSADNNEEESKEMMTLDEKELRTLFKGFEGHRQYAAVVVDGTTGLRRGELLALRWTDINLDSAMLSVARSLEETKEFGLNFKPPKTKRSKRIFDIGSMTVEVLRHHATAQKKARLAAGPAWVDEGLVFPTLDGSRWRPSSFTSAFIDRVRTIGFTGFRFQDLRHTHTSQLLRAGVPVMTVSARLGHSSAKMTLDRYAHSLPADQKRAALTLDTLLQAAALPG
jgi:integrase